MSIAGVVDYVDYPMVYSKYKIIIGMRFVMKLYVLNATPVQSKEQMVEAGYDITETNTVEHNNSVHLEEYPRVVSSLLQKYGIDGFTMYQVQGFWMGSSEVSFKIEIATDAAYKIRNIADELRTMYNQDSVMLTTPENSVEFI